jgi:DNA polymerase
MDILFIGEGPGETEDKEGMPFVGKAGTFLRETIEEQNPEGLKLGFANLVACRPTPRKGKNRPPEYLEVRTCSPRLRDFVRIVQPLMVVGLGRVPETYLPRILKEAEYTGRRLVFRHPSFFLHNGGQNSPAYPDWAEAFRILFTVVRGMKEKGMK